MILINQIKIKPGYKEYDLTKKIASILKVLPEDISNVKLVKKSIDARKNKELFFVISVACDVKHEDSVLKRIDKTIASKYLPVEYKFEVTGQDELINRPVIIGAGPAGLFCAYFLSLSGYKPIILERGYDVELRTKDVENFWNGGKLLKNSNVLFGEGGAGTFSDGKLNTLVKDKEGRNREVLKIFCENGANESILYDSKPHVGTDVLKKVVKSIREKIILQGGEIRFNAQVTDILTDNGKICSVTINNNDKIQCECVVLCCGHSARDTFKMLYENGVYMEQKDFAVGLRVEHSQDMINNALYNCSEEEKKYLPPASYKLTFNASNGRGVYSFCMCPGGYVVNASSEEGLLCVNGMSYSGRDGENANSAIVVSVSSKDFGGDHPLQGIEFQRKLEEKAYIEGNGSIPVQIYGDFKADVEDSVNMDDVSDDSYIKVKSQTKGFYTRAKVSNILPKEISKTLIEGMEYFDHIIPGFASPLTLLSGVESRTSSPVRITRGDDFQSITVKGLFPCGEGAGYAGGITSAAMDGMKIAEQIAKIYKPVRN